MASGGGGSGGGEWGENDRGIMSDEEYERGYGHPRGANAKVNFLEGK